MTTTTSAPTCRRPCPAVEAARGDTDLLRAHILSGAGCVDGWIALARLQSSADRRLDCLARAAALAQDDLDLQSEYLACRLAVYPNDRQAATQLEQLRVLQTLNGAAPSVFRRMQRVRSLGEILVDAGAISEHELRLLLNEQLRQTQSGRRSLLGDMLVANRRISPEELVGALMTQYRERLARGDMPQALGEYLVYEGYITPQALEHAIIEQIRLRLAKREESIGAILLRQRAVDQATIQRALQRQKDDALARYE
jgi:hypothetical protein